MPTLDGDIRYQTGPQDWAAVRSLTRELERTERVAAAIAQWDLAVRLFRQTEQTQFYEKEPAEIDRANHRSLLHILIGVGQNLLLETQVFRDEELAGYGITRADLAAYIADLEDTFFTFYVPDFEPDKTAKVREVVFGAKT